MRWGFKALELALALDNTGSMAAKNKMVELKSAVKLLFSILKTNSKVPGDTKIAVIPFSTVVNVGAEHVDAPWIDLRRHRDQGELDRLRRRPRSTERCEGRNTERRQRYTVSRRSMRVAGEDAPLTEDWDALNAMVDAMTPSGMTNVTIGMAWGWHGLTQKEPFKMRRRRSSLTSTR